MPFSWNCRSLKSQDRMGSNQSKNLEWPSRPKLCRARTPKRIWNRYLNRKSVNPKLNLKLWLKGLIQLTVMVTRPFPDRWQFQSVHKKQKPRRAKLTSPPFQGWFATSLAVGEAKFELNTRKQLKWNDLGNAQNTWFQWFNRHNPAIARLSPDF